MNPLTNHEYGIVGACLFGLFWLLSSLVKHGFRYFSTLNSTHRSEREDWHDRSDKREERAMLLLDNNNAALRKLEEAIRTLDKESDIR